MSLFFVLFSISLKKSLRKKVSKKWNILKTNPKHFSEKSEV
jgi:hypothetical protein